VVAEDVQRVIDDPNLLWSGAAGAILGGVVVAAITIGYTEFRENRQRVRERAGLARVIADEVGRNGRLLENSKAPPVEEPEVKEILKVASGTSLPSADAWRESKVRLAQLIDIQDLEAISDYYTIVQSLETPSGATTAIRVRADEPDWQERTDDVNKRLARYAKLRRSLCQRMFGG
jgi:hypothetical protein